MTHTSSQTLKAGCLVEIIQGNSPQVAWVLDITENKARLFTLHKREIKIPVNRLLPWFGPSYPQQTKEDIVHTLQDAEKNREELMKDINILELWNTVQGEMENASPQLLADFLWEKPTAEQIASLARVLFATKTHFKFQAPNFLIYSEEKVVLLKEQKIKENEKEKLQHIGMSIFSALWEAFSTGKNPVLPEMETEAEDFFKKLILHALTKKLTEEEIIIWNYCKKQLPDTPLLAFYLAKSYGLISEHYNGLLDELDYCFDDSWAHKHVADIENIKNKFNESIKTHNEISYITIDDISTQDRDDAFFLKKNSDNSSILDLAFALPSLHWDYNSELSKAVEERTTSLYFPEGTAHMLPKELGTDLYSLSEKEPRPALCMQIHIAEDGTILNEKFFISWILVEKNWSYQAVQKMLMGEISEVGENNETSGNENFFQDALQLANLLLGLRTSDGAVTIIQDNIHIKLSNDKESSDDENSTNKDTITDKKNILDKGNITVSLIKKEPTHDAELIVSEFMIFANTRIALFAKEKEIPLLHRTQNIALPSDAVGIFHDPIDIFKVIKFLAAPILETEAKRHAALAVPAYAPISSPIRRYVDFINVTQIQNFLENGSAKFSKEELDKFLLFFTSRSQQINGLQKKRPKYWKYVYLAQNKKKGLEALVVDANSPMPMLFLAELQIYLRVSKNILGEKVYNGQYFLLTFGKIDPHTSEIKVTKALES